MEIEVAPAVQYRRLARGLAGLDEKFLRQHLLKTTAQNWLYEGKAGLKTGLSYWFIVESKSVPTF